MPQTDDAGGLGREEQGGKGLFGKGMGQAPGALPHVGDVARRGGDIQSKLESCGELDTLHRILIRCVQVTPWKTSMDPQNPG